MSNCFNFLHPSEIRPVVLVHQSKAINLSTKRVKLIDGLTQNFFAIKFGFLYNVILVVKLFCQRLDHCWQHFALCYDSLTHCLFS